jgi:hypothetical protein
MPESIIRGRTGFDVPPDQFDDTMSVNVRVPFFASQWVAKRLIAAGESGAIVTTASAVGQRGSVVAEYGSSKAAVINLTRRLGTRLGRHGIRVNATGSDQHGDGRSRAAGSEGWCQGKRTGPHWGAGGNRIRGGFPGERRRVVHHLRDHRRERRLVTIELMVRSPCSCRVLGCFPSETADTKHMQQFGGWANEAHHSALPFARLPAFVGKPLITDNQNILATHSARCAVAKQR